MQPVDFTTLTATCHELRSNWLPARLEQVYQRDRFTIALALRTLKQRSWLTISWHPVGARVCIGDPPPRTRDTFTFSDQLRHLLGGFALISLKTIAPFERVLNLGFAKRPHEEPLWHLYIEIMGKYSNVILTDSNNQIVTVAHQVSAAQSSFRTVQTGQLYEQPPALTASIPNLAHSQAKWQEKVSLVPGEINRQLLKSYRGLSPSLVRSMLKMANIDPKQSTDSLSDSDWQKLFTYWQKWLQTLENGDFQPGFTPNGYTVMGWDMVKPLANVQILLQSYYNQQLNQEFFRQLRHQLMQKVGNLLSKLEVKADSFRKRLEQSDDADHYRQQADLLMANLNQWQPGMQSIILNDFTTGEPVKIDLNQAKNAVQNAQALYKLHQKMKRARNAIEPLLQQVVSEINYLQQVESTLSQLDDYENSEDLETLEDIRTELIQQKYLEANPKHTSSNTKDESKPYIYISPSGFEVWIGRNNRQNDYLSFRIATDYDLWFHTQEIPGSHVLLRLDAGAVTEQTDLQFVANLAAFYSRGRESEQVPVVYTEPKYVYKPKGAKPGMAIYKHERIIWGQPQQGKNIIQKNLQKN